MLRGHLPLLDDEHDEGGRHEREGDTDDEGSKEGTHTLAAGKLLLSKRQWMVERLWSHTQHEPAVHNHQRQRMRLYAHLDAGRWVPTGVCVHR